MTMTTIDKYRYPNLYRSSNGRYYVRCHIHKRIFQKSLETTVWVIAKRRYEHLSLKVLDERMSPVPILMRKKIELESRTRLDVALSEWVALSKARGESRTGIYSKSGMRNEILKLKIRYIDEVDQAAVDRWEGLCREKNKAQNTLLHDIKQFRAFLNFAISKRYYTQVQYETLQWPKARYQRRTEGAIISEADYAKLLKHPEIVGDESRRVYLMSLWEFGLRTHSEGGHLNYEDIDWENRILRVRQSKIEKSSGDAGKQIPISKEFLSILRDYCSSRGIISGPLFRETRKNAASWCAVHFQRMLADCGITEHYTLYSFRHTFATRLYKMTKDVEFVRAVMGHKSLTYTISYLHTHAPDLLTTFDEAVARLKGKSKGRKSKSKPRLVKAS